MALDIVCKWTLIGRLGNANYILSIAYEVNDFCGLWILPRATSFNRASNGGATGWYMDTLITLIHSNRLYNHKMTKHKKRAYCTVTLSKCVRTIMKTHGSVNYLPISVYYMPIDRLWCGCNHRKTRDTQGAYNLLYCLKRKNSEWFTLFCLHICPYCTPVFTLTCPARDILNKLFHFIQNTIVLK